MEAINSYDDAHLSFGIMQWTAGPGDDPGELAALLLRIKAAASPAFDDCFGRFGLDARLEFEGATTGRLVLNGEVLDSSERMDVLRSIDWAYRFWRAGHHPEVRNAQIAHAQNRIELFANAPASGRLVRDWFTSEVGLTLVLDEHVNRPSHVPRTLAAALSKLFGPDSPDPTNWRDVDEQRLIDAYLEERETTSMTDSFLRGQKIVELARAGMLSSARGSFAFS